MIGLMDRVAIWSTVLTADQVLEWYNVYSSLDSIKGGASSVGTLQQDLPTGFTLQANYPNPFNPVTNIAYSIDKSTEVQLTVFDITGRIVTTLVDQQQSAGTYTVQWNGRNRHGEAMPSGVYFYKLVTPDNSMVHKMMLVK
jgi:hypothetical protein